MNIEHIKELKREEINRGFLMLINKVDLLVKTGLISEIDKFLLFPGYKDLMEEYNT